MLPLTFHTTYVHPVWGGDAISRARGLAADAERNFGEAFDVTAHPDVCVTIANGPLAGMRLDDAIRAHHDEILGDVPEDDVIQITFMDARETLSVQVHPDEELARRLDGDHAKVESWYVLDAEPGATLIAGSTTRDVGALRAAAADDTIGDAFGRRVEMHPGDFILIPAGTMHALGAGIFAVEVGSFGNQTYRMCDWGRGRELHVEKAFEALDTASSPVPRHLGAFDKAACATAGGVLIREGAACDLFLANVVDIVGSWHADLDGAYQIITCVEGSCTVETADGSVRLGYTESALVPASAGSFTVRGSCRVIQSLRPASTRVR